MGLIYELIDIINRLFLQSSYSSKILIWNDVAISILCTILLASYLIYILVNLKKLDKTNNFDKYLANLNKLKSFSCNLIIFIGVLSRAHFLDSAAQGNPFLTSNMISTFYELIFTIGRLVFLYFLVRIIYTSSAFLVSKFYNSKFNSKYGNAT